MADFLPIAEHGIMGDLHTVALTATDGTIDWYCCPSFDSPSVFASILDREKGGYYRISPAMEGWRPKQLYFPDTNVLITRFLTPNGVGEIQGFMPIAESTEDVHRHRLIRRVEGVRGEMRFRVELQPRFNYGRDEHEIVQYEHGVVFRSPSLCLALQATTPIACDERGVHCEFTVRAGSSVTFVLERVEPDYVPREYSEAETRSAYEATIAFWRNWVSRSQYRGRWREMVNRSALTLKLLTYRPTGAIVAAPTTSLPEEIGGSRNWDYRFTWLRDASFTLDAFIRLGLDDEAHAFFWWLMHASRLTQPRLQILYKVDGSTHTDEQELSQLSGYRGSAPVRIGNGAAHQVQLDVYGAVLEAIWLYARGCGHVDGDTAKEVAKIADYVTRHWRDPDNGIWEVRAERTDFTQSKALCWVALDRACKLADRGIIPDRSERWRAAADEIRDFVDREGWDDERRSYVRAPDLRELDASLLTLAILSFDRPESARLRGTTDAIDRELREGPFVYRYRGADGVPGEEGAFLTCSFWFVDALARQGRLDDAHRLMDELVALANDVGLYSEEIDPQSWEFLGNFPQGLTHLALINAAVSITDAER